MLSGFKTHGRVMNLTCLGNAPGTIALSCTHGGCVVHGMQCPPAPSLGAQGKETGVRLALSNVQGAQQDTPQTTRGPTPIKLGQLKQLLHFYPKKEVARRLVSGFQFGFRIPAPAPSRPT